MPTDAATMLAFATGCAAFVIALTVQRLSMKNDGGSARKSRASMLGALLQGLAIGLSVGSVRMAGESFPAPGALPRLLAVVALMAGCTALFTWAARTMGQNWAIVARTRTDHELVTGGPFAHVRHPIYIALFLFMLGAAIATGHEKALILTAPLYFLATLFRAGEEERLLRAHFGATYDAYAARVKRFVPSIF